MALTLVVPSAADIGAVSAEVAANLKAAGNPDANLAYTLRVALAQILVDLTALAAGTEVAAATAAAAGVVSLVQQMGPTRSVRGVVTASIADLSAFTVASNDGLTYAVNQRLLYANGGVNDGIYVVGTVTGPTAPLTRATDYAASSVQPAGLEINVNEGTLWGNRKWFASLAGAITVGTSLPAFYPRKYVRVTTAMSGTPGIKALSAEWILSTSKSTVNVMVITPGTQGFLSRGALSAGAGDGSFTITSTANETSTLQVTIEN